MTKDQIKSQYIIVLGTTYSGCGAIYDYLNNRGDLYEPLKGQEYELPQLVNVLRGEMSLIGPRPALYNQINLKNLRAQNFIHELKPGITGYAQVHGIENMNDEDKIKFDLYYLNNLSFFLDLKIIISTFKFFFKKAPKH